MFLTPWCGPKEQNHAVNAVRVISTGKTRVRLILFDQFLRQASRAVLVCPRSEPGKIERQAAEGLTVQGARVAPAMLSRRAAARDTGLCVPPSALDCLLSTRKGQPHWSGERRVGADSV